MRNSLYVKDDDFLLSYMYGNFITLTNISKDNLDRIVKYRLEPLYISVHSFDKKIREYIFGNKKTMCALENLKFLDEKGIKTHIQIVLCPGINDGKYLEDTLLKLITGYNNILSIGIVPVGITKYNKNKNLKPCTGKNAAEVIDSVCNFKIQNNLSNKVNNIFLSDEFYITGGIKFPAYEYYKNFYQIRNGIGKSIHFLKQVNDFIKNKNSAKLVINNKKNNILIITSEYGKVIIDNALNAIYGEAENHSLKTGSFLKVLDIRNRFLGGNIKVTGLLGGRDIESNLIKEDLEIYDKILIPDIIFNMNNVTIDEYKREDIEKIGKNIKIIPEDGFSFIKEINNECIRA